MKALGKKREDRFTDVRAFQAAVERGLSRGTAS